MSPRVPALRAGREHLLHEKRPGIIDSGSLFVFVKNDPAKLGHFCRAGGAPFYALRGVMGWMDAEIPAGCLGLAGMRAPAEDSPPSGGCPVGAIVQANRVFDAANSVRGCGTRRRGRLSLAAWPDRG